MCFGARVRWEDERGRAGRGEDGGGGGSGRRASVLARRRTRGSARCSSRPTALRSRARPNRPAAAHAEIVAIDAAGGRGRHRAAPPCTRPSSRAPTAGAPGRAPTRSSRRASPEWSIGIEDPDRTRGRPRASPGCGRRASRSTSASAPSAVRGQLAPVHQAPHDRPPVGRAEARRLARRPHRRARRHQPVDHGAGGARRRPPAASRERRRHRRRRHRAGRRSRPHRARRRRATIRLRVVLGTAPADAKVHPCVELDGPLEDVLDELGAPRRRPSDGRGRRDRRRRVPPRAVSSIATCSTSRLRCSAATTRVPCSPERARRPSTTSGADASRPSIAWATTSESSWSHVHRHSRRARQRRAHGTARTLRINASLVLDDVQLGASIAVNGCCLTVVDWGSDDGDMACDKPTWWAADVVDESYRAHRPRRAARR